MSDLLGGQGDAPEPEIIPPRRRGRPRTNGAAPGPDPDLLHPGGDAGDPGASTTGAKTRKPGARGSKADRLAKWTTDIKGAHELAAAMMQMPDLRVSDAEAETIAGPAMEVAEKYGWGGGIGPEFRLVFALGSIWGPMAFRIQMELLRRRADAARHAEAAPADAPGPQTADAGNVYSFADPATAGDGAGAY